MRFAVIGCLLGMVLPSFAQTGSRPRNIFDDDWEPPKRPAASQPVVTPKVTPKPVDPVTPANVTPANTTPTVTPVTTPTTTARRPVPNSADQATVRKLMKQLYADQLKDTTPAGRKKLTAALIEQAEKLASDAPTDQFVLLTAAVDAGVGGSNLPLAFTAADRLARGFEVDGLDVKADAVTRFKSTVAADAAENVRAAIALSLELEAADDLATAIRICTVVQPVAAGSPDLRNQVVARLRELSAAKELAERVGRDREKLTATPDDPAANLSVGRFECLARGRWEIGLPHLAKGSDAVLKKAAQTELDAGDSPQPSDAIRVADVWWDIAASQTEARFRAAMIVHAANFYQQGLKGVTGLQKTLVEKRLAEARGAMASASGRVDLLALFDPAKDAVKGQWEATPEGLISDRGNEHRVAFPYQPPPEYDMIVEFTRLEGTEHVFVLFTWGGHNGGCILGSDGGKICGISQIDGRAASDGKNPTMKTFPNGVIHQGKRQRCVLEVRKSGVRAVLDEVEVINFRGQPTQVSQNSPWAIQEGLVGVAKVAGRVAFHTVELRPVSGAGKSLRPPSK